MVEPTPPFPTSGWIEVIVGSMYSGKTEELIRRLRRAQIARQRVEIFKPAIDDRYARDHIVSHSELRIPSRAARHAASIRRTASCPACPVTYDHAASPYHPSRRRETSIVRRSPWRSASPAPTPCAAVALREAKTRMSWAPRQAAGSRRPTAIAATAPASAPATRALGAARNPRWP